MFIGKKVKIKSLKLWLLLQTSDKVPEDMLTLLYHLAYTVKWIEIALKWGFLIFTILLAIILFRILFRKFSTKKQLVLISKKRKANNRDVICSKYIVT